MDEFELRRVEQEIRDTLADTALEWVLDEVDAAIAAGVPEEKILRRRANRGSDDRRSASPAAEAARYETVERRMLSPEAFEASRKGGTLVIATRPMADSERVELLLDALRRVIVELPEIELETLKTLYAAPESDEGTRHEVHDVAFEPEENARHRRERSAVLADRMPRERRERISALFVNAVSEVRS
jgi:hypothetical protein